MVVAARARKHGTGSDDGVGVRRLSVLLLADDQKGHPDAIHDHIRSFARYSRHAVTLINPRGLTRSRFLSVESYDVVVVHFSILLTSDSHLSPWLREQITAYTGLKVQFLQDEYRRVDDFTAAARSLGIDVLYSVVPADKIDAVYGTRLPSTEIVPTLTGYVPETLEHVTTKPIAARSTLPS